MSDELPVGQRNQLSQQQQLDRIETLLKELVEMLRRYMGEAAQGRGLGH